MKVEMNGNNNINRGDPPSIKEPVYDVSGYTTDSPVKMTSLTNPHHIVIGQQVYDALDDCQKSMHQHLNLIQTYRIMSAVVLEGTYTKFIQVSEQDIQKIHFLIILERNRPILE